MIRSCVCIYKMHAWLYMYVCVWDSTEEEGVCREWVGNESDGGITTTIYDICSLTKFFFLRGWGLLFLRFSA